MGEFGRTPKIPRPDGRDHWPNSFSAVLAGGGIKGGQVIGDTGPTGRPSRTGRWRCRTSGHRLRGAGHRPEKQNLSNVGRPDPHRRTGHEGGSGGTGVAHETAEASRERERPEGEPGA